MPKGAAPFELRPWGGYQTLERGPGYQVKRLVVQPGHRFSLQKHRRRAEHWTIVAGSAKVTLDGRSRRVGPRESLTVPRGTWHRVENVGRVPVIIVEVQFGAYLGEDDIIRKHDDYGRAGG